MNYTTAAVVGLRAAVVDVLGGKASLEDIRQRVRYNVNGAVRVTRRGEAPAHRWPVELWPITIAHVCDGGCDGYADRVGQWALSIIATLEAADEISSLPDR